VVCLIWSLFFALYATYSDGGSGKEGGSNGKEDKRKGSGGDIGGEGSGGMGLGNVKLEPPDVHLLAGMLCLAVGGAAWVWWLACCLR
jgi:hypothetical protein